jgi:hypothetical protein
VRAAAALAALLVLGGCASAAPAPVAKPLRMRQPRAGHTATFRYDRKVLLAGGCSTARCHPATRTTEVFDGKRFRPGPRLSTPREGHTAVALLGGGVLLAGGYERKGGPPLASAELVSGSHARPVGPMTTARAGHVAVALNTAEIGDGGRGGLTSSDYRTSVLVAGGAGADGRALRSAEVYDRTHRSWRAVPPMHHARIGATATLVSSRRVLVTGGIGPDGAATASAEIFDPNQETWTDAPPMGAARARHGAVYLGDNSVLVVGGVTRDHGGSVLDSAEYYDNEVRSPDYDTWNPVGSMAQPRAGVAASVARPATAHDALVTGGAPGVEVYDAAAKRFTTLVPGGETRRLATATAFPFQTLVAGGYDGEGTPTDAATVITS